MSCHRIWLNYNARSFVFRFVRSFVRSILYIGWLYLSTICVYIYVIPNRSHRMVKFVYAVHAIRFRRAFATQPTSSYTTIYIYTSIYTEYVLKVYINCHALFYHCLFSVQHSHSHTACTERTEPLKQPRIAKAHPNC